MLKIERFNQGAHCVASLFYVNIEQQRVKRSTLSSKDCVFLAFLLRYRNFMENNYTSIALPCIKGKQIAAKFIAKDKLALVIVFIKFRALHFEVAWPY